MWKFIHAADIHLDSPIQRLERYEGAPLKDLRRSTRQALENLVELAIAETVSFVLIAGDLYDGNWQDHGTGLYLNAQLSRLRDAGIPVFVIRGNHDAVSQITRHLRLPENVRMLDNDKPESIALDDLGVVLHGQSFAKRAVKENLAAAYPERWANYVNIGLLHTCASGREGHEPYAPCSIEDLRSKGYQYWALGHIHKREILHRDPPILFSGNLQGRHARETGAKGCTLVTVAGDRVSEFVHRPIDVIRWENGRIDATGAVDLDDLLERVDSRLRAIRDESDGRMLAVRVEIVGACKAHSEVTRKPEQVVAEVRNVARDIGDGAIWVEKIKLRTSPPKKRDPDHGPLGMLLDYLDELRQDEAALLALAASELSDLRKKLPAELRDGEDSLDLGSPAVLREALDQIGPLIVEGLTEEGGDA